jgi:soluble lytic murein transglycosylase-like protein
VAVAASPGRLIRVIFGGLVVVVTLASVLAAAALEIDLPRVRPDVRVAYAEIAAPRAADLVTARKSASGSRSSAQSTTTESGAASARATAPASPVAAVPVKMSDFQQRYEPIARAAAMKYGIDPDVFVRQITQESHWDPTSVSPSGAQGIAQFMPTTAASRHVDPLDPIAALDAAAKLDHENLIAFDGDYAKMLAAYNAGRGSVIRYSGIPPFPETQNYVALILGTP